MRDVLNRTITNEIRRTGGGNRKDQNLISYGYRSKVSYCHYYYYYYSNLNILYFIIRDGIQNWRLEMV